MQAKIKQKKKDILTQFNQNQTINSQFKHQVELNQRLLGIEYL